MKILLTQRKSTSLAARFLFACIFCFFSLTVSFGQERLIIVGGGKRPPAAVKRFVDWAGGEAKAKVLIITWASGVPQESFEGAKKDFDVFKPVVEVAPFAPLDETKRAQFLNQLKTATGIFFTGGDQNRIMDVLKDRELLQILREKYQQGTVFGGTSAGTAIMSNLMMTGEADLTKISPATVETREGLGLLPDSIIDQHFIKRQRENRLFSLILKHPSLLGIGIDEDTALAVADNRRAEVLGATQVMFIDARKQKAAFVIHLLNNTEKFDLHKRKRIPQTGKID